jgi:2-(1,2-epoxy-1,2-dihydrophenyl)acetyl-CoA isomerase
VPDCGGSFHLARRLGPGRALLWLAENRAMPAEEALTLGLAHRVVPEADLEAEAEALCARLVAGPRLALAAARSLLRGAALRDLPDHLTAERNAFLQCAGTADFREGLAAFLARRPARFANSTPYSSSGEAPSPTTTFRPAACVWCNPNTAGCRFPSVSAASGKRR